ncbi:hypothetical protein AKG11_28120 [Shinella sp. SUS2]|uniref:hypothetical protein n=1 Tax=unclassified Shinella TaxID=2643062 RepID=UPI0006838035|nr:MULTISPECIES: hypothetical protein [unclassified Shinella]KNY13607.1 hypothetical protein AKG11_28120 [Shinella sp. SUS2]KOC72500.1 hypothetical protein AKG10_26985 [Shinella sp. GWS1]
MGTEIAIDLDEDEPRAAAPDIVDEDTKVAASAPIDGDIVDEDFAPADRLPAQAVRNLDGTVTLPLAYPQTITSRKDGKIRERKFDQLVFHRLNGADQRAIQAASEEMLAVVAIGQSTKINQAVMNRLYDKMDASDIANAGQVLNHFLASGRKTGR